MEGKIFEPMTYEMFKEQDKKGLYSSFISVNLAKRFTQIPVEFSEVIPDKCECKSDFIINKNNKTIRCCNPSCYIKLGKRLSLMYSNFGIKDLGDATCIKIIKFCFKNKLLQIPSHVEVLKIVENDFMAMFLGAKWNIFISANEQIRRTRMSFGKLVKSIGMPTFSDSCETILENVSGIGELLKIIKDGELEDFMMSKGVYSLKRIEEIRNPKNLLSILEFESILKVPLIKPGLVNKTVCITGRVSADGYNFSREEFLAYCTELGCHEGIQFFTVKTNKALMSTNHIIADRPSTTDKYLAGLQRERNGEKGILITAQEYVDMLREEVKMWTTEMKELNKE